MQTIKRLDSAIERATNESITEIPFELLKQILEIINQRVDMPKHLIANLSKRIIFKNKRVLINCFNLLQFLCYQCELSLYSQISTKEFLKKISGLLINKDLQQEVKSKILQTLYCWNELFRPHEDLLPIFFEFYAGVLRNGYEIPFDYTSKYRPSELKIYKKTQHQLTQKIVDKKNEYKKQYVVPTQQQLKIFQQIREELILTNEIIDNSNPSDNVKQNGLLLEMIQHIKQCEKKVNKSINQNPSQKVMEFALAANDDIFITYRRFKDLQKNKKPQPFILTQLSSDLHRDQQKKIVPILKQQQKKQIKKQQQNIINQQNLSQGNKKQQKNDKKIDNLFDWQAQLEGKVITQNHHKQENLIDQNNQTNYIPQPVNQNNYIYQQSQNQQNNINGINLQQKNNTSQQFNNINNINNINLDSLLITQNYQGVTMPSPSQYGISINANDFKTQMDIKTYNNQSALDKLQELTYKFLKK